MEGMNLQGEHRSSRDGGRKAPKPRREDDEDDGESKRPSRFPTPGGDDSSDFLRSSFNRRYPPPTPGAEDSPHFSTQLRRKGSHGMAPRSSNPEQHPPSRSWQGAYPARKEELSPSSNSAPPMWYEQEIERMRLQKQGLHYDRPREAPNPRPAPGEWYQEEMERLRREKMGQNDENFHQEQPGQWYQEEMERLRREKLGRDVDDRKSYHQEREEASLSSQSTLGQWYQYEMGRLHRQEIGHDSLGGAPYQQQREQPSPSHNTVQDQWYQNEMERLRREKLGHDSNGSIPYQEREQVSSSGDAASGQWYQEEMERLRREKLGHDSNSSIPYREREQANLSGDTAPGQWYQEEMERLRREKLGHDSNGSIPYQGREQASSSGDAAPGQWYQEEVERLRREKLGEEGYEDDLHAASEQHSSSGNTAPAQWYLEETERIRRQKMGSDNNGHPYQYHQERAGTAGVLGNDYPDYKPMPDDGEGEWPSRYPRNQERSEGSHRDKGLELDADIRPQSTNSQSYSEGGQSAYSQQLDRQQEKLGAKGAIIHPAGSTPRENQQWPGEGLTLAAGLSDPVRRQQQHASGQRLSTNRPIKGYVDPALPLPGAYESSSRPTGAVPEWVARRYEEERRQRMDDMDTDRPGQNDVGDMSLPPELRGVAVAINNTTPFDSAVPPELRGLVDASNPAGVSASAAFSTESTDGIHNDASDNHEAPQRVVTAACRTSSQVRRPDEVVDSPKLECLPKDITKRRILFAVIGILVGLAAALGVGVGVSLSGPKSNNVDSGPPATPPRDGPEPEACDLAVVSTQCQMGDESPRMVLDCFAQKHRQQYEHMKNSLLLSIEPDFDESPLSCEASNVAIWALASSGLEFSSQFFLSFYVLTTLYFETNGNIWLRNDNWLSFNVSVCTWHGITCGRGDFSEDVIGIELKMLGLVGTVPSQLGLLTTLVGLSLSGNALLAGSIPSHIARLDGLDLLALGRNGITGSLPTEISGMKELVTLQLHQNLLTGTLPTELGLATRLVELFLQSNMITGTLPTEIGQMRSLGILDVSLNDLKGTLPSALGDLTELVTLDVVSNALRGTIPSEIFVSSNSLVRMDMSSNRMNGTIPTNIGDLRTLQYFSVLLNSLTGPLPSEIGKLTSLVVLALEGNNLSGFIPDEVCELLESSLHFSTSGDDKCLADSYGGLKCPYIECCESCPNLVEGPPG